MTTDSLTAYLVEDEPLCRTDFRHILKEFPEIRLVGEGDTLEAAKDFLSRTKVDLVFLDLSLGRENGLDLLEDLKDPPMVIALTAHPQYAVRGFSLNLVDYVLKPVEKNRLSMALDKAKHRKVSSSLEPGRVTFLAEIDGKKTTLELGEIQGVEAMGNYVLLETTRGRAIKRSTFKKVRGKLPPAFFLETGRGRIVARERVKSWQRDPKGTLHLFLQDQLTLRVSPKKVNAVMKALELGDSI